MIDFTEKLKKLIELLIFNIKSRLGLFLPLNTCETLDL